MLYYSPLELILQAKQKKVALGSFNVFNIEMFHFLHFIIRVVGLHFDGYKEDFLNGISNNE